MDYGLWINQYNMNMHKTTFLIVNRIPKKYFYYNTILFLSFRALTLMVQGADSVHTFSHYYLYMKNKFEVYNLFYSLWTFIKNLEASGWINPWPPRKQNSECPHQEGYIEERSRFSQCLILVLLNNFWSAFQSFSVPRSFNRGT